MRRNFKTIHKINIQKQNTDENRGKKKRRWGIKSCLSILLAATVTTTTIYSQVLYAQAETGEAPDGKIPFYHFQQLKETEYTLPVKDSKEATISRLYEMGLPKTLTVTTQPESVPPEPVIPDMPKEDITVSDNDTDVTDVNVTEDISNPDVTDKDLTGDLSGSGVEDTETSGGVDTPEVKDPENPSGSGTEGTDTAEGTDNTEVKDPENPSGSEVEGTDTAEGTDNTEDKDFENPSGSEAEGTDTDGETDNTEVKDSTENSSGSDAEGTDASQKTGSSDGGTTARSVTVPDMPVNSAPEEAPVVIMTSKSNADSDVTNNNPGGSTGSGESGEPQTIELEVEWDCDYYEEIRDSYVFTPKWNEEKYDYKGTQEEIQEITVKFEDILAIPRVTKEDELEAAFENLSTDGSEYRIILQDNIALSKTLEVVLPAGANVTLQSDGGEDGTVYSLTRGSTDPTNPGAPPFTDAMLKIVTPEAVQAAGDVPMPLAEDQNAGGTLTLRDITIDGKKVGVVSDPSYPDNQVNAPAVIVNGGHLTLENGASVINNYNIGTYLVNENGQPVLDENGANIYAIPPCGGGIWACGGVLELQKGCHISNNHAVLSGGGVYLDSGAVLRYYAEAEALTGNTVHEGGTGADLYACAGSTICYDPALFVIWSTFYIDPAAEMIPDGSALDMDTPIEIYLNVSENSGYSFREVKDKLESTFGDRVTVLLPKTYIDTTDLRNWYVYDHYDSNCWDATDTNGNNIPDSWEKAYREYLHRPYYVYNTSYTPTNGKINDIPTWLKGSNTSTLVPFKEHIYSRIEKGMPEMTFAGYDVDANVDFLFYDPKSNGQKVVEFDVDSSKVNTHTLTNTGFLVNTGVKNSGNDQLLSGYLVYYTYGAEMKDEISKDPETGNEIHTQVPTGRIIAKTISLIKFDDVSINSLHNGGGIYALTRNSQTIQVLSGSDNPSQLNWDSQMSIEITVDPDQVTVKQWPKKDADSSAAQTFTWSLGENTGADAGSDTDEDVSGNDVGGAAGGNTVYNGFGPLVAYNSHACSIASSFTYSNLRMWFTNPDEEKTLMSPLMEADFSQEEGNDKYVKKYYMNLLGTSGNKYNTMDEDMGKEYFEYLYMMQDEGIGLITDADTPFEPYLGQNGSQNLYEISSLAGKADLDALVTSLRSYLPRYSSTVLSDKVASDEITRAEPQKAIGNIWLKNPGGDDRQISRILDGNKLPEYFWVEIMDISYNPGGDTDISYSLLKPGSSRYLPLPLGSEGGSGEDSAVFFSVRGATGVNFVITHDENEWPAGEYTVRQQISGSEIYGYSYFTLLRPTFVEEPPEIPPENPPENPPVISPAETPVVSTPVSGSSGGSHSSEPVLEAPEITVPSVIQPTVTSDGASQPKTGDGMFPAIPVACGACTAFMMKIMLWMYDVDFDIVTEHKEEVVRSLILWGKGSTRPRIYLAIVALTAVITAYHLLKAFVANSKQIVRERLGI